LKPIRDEYARELEALARDRKSLQAEYNQLHALVEAWATAQRPVLFAAKRSIEFLRGTIGFRLDAPSVVTLPKWTFTKAVQALKGTRWGKAYLAWREPVLDKEAIIKDRALLAKRGRLGEVGLTIAQEDRFYFEPKRETSDAIKEAA
jgi:phage host-nuclease inhibitor protein Gam